MFSSSTAKRTEWTRILKASRLWNEASIRQGYDLAKIPLVFQYNKRDMHGAVSLQELEATFNPRRRQQFEAVANRGEGVMETLQAISQAVIRELKGLAAIGGGDNMNKEKLKKFKRLFECATSEFAL